VNQNGWAIKMHLKYKTANSLVKNAYDYNNCSFHEYRVQEGETSTDSDIDVYNDYENDKQF
jgi:hypothetical protein